MSEVSARAGVPVEASIRAVITRADGTVEDLGVISYWHRNPLRRLLFKLTKKVV